MHPFLRPSLFLLLLLLFSLLPISLPLSSPEPQPPTPADLSITSLMSKNGCKSFSFLLRSSPEASDSFSSNINSGLTAFCPTDPVLNPFLPLFQNLSADAKISLLLYHAVPIYYSIQMLQSNNGVVNTLATDGTANNYNFTIQNDADAVTLRTRVTTARIIGTIYDEDPLAVYAVDHVLQPAELFHPAEAPAPVEAPVDSPKAEDGKKGKRGSAPAASPEEKAADQKASAGMTGGSLFRRAKKVVTRGGSSRGESSRSSQTPSTPVHPDSSDDHECSETQLPPRHSFQEASRSDDGVWLIDDQGTHTRRRGRTTCADIQSMPAGTRVHIEINANGVPCNIPKSTLLGSYMGVIARDPMLAPLSFPDWRNKGMEPFKKKMLAEVESKFEFPENIRHWVLQSLGVKWRNFKSSLKAEFWDNRPIEEIMEAVPNGIDAAQWCQLVTQWAQPEDQARAATNIVNAKKQTCPHTMGRVSSVRRQHETTIHDRLLLWRINRLRKDGSWSSEDARLRWAQACEILAEEGLTPEDGNLEAN